VSQLRAIDQEQPFTVDGNATTLRPHLCLPLDQKQHLRGDILIEAPDMFQARSIGLFNASLTKFIECGYSGISIEVSVKCPAVRACILLLRFSSNSSRNAFKAWRRGV
jgi:hypothetical protein